MNLFDKVKQETFIFTNDQILNKIEQLNNTVTYKLTELDVVFDLYEDKQTLTKEEYRTEIIQYLYVNSSSPKTVIDKVLIDNKDWFYEQYDEAINNKTIYYHAVQQCRHELMNFLQPKYNQPGEYDEDDDCPDDE
jgi:hypothetical protein